MTPILQRFFRRQRSEEFIRALRRLILLWCWNLTITLEDNYRRTSLVAQLENLPVIQKTPVRFLGQEDPLERLSTPVFLGFPGGSDSKESTCNSGDVGLIPVSGRSPREGNSYPLQCSCLENSMDRGTWQAEVHGVAKSWTWMSDFHLSLMEELLCKTICHILRLGK